MSLGPTELIVILVIVLILFGAGKLPQVFSSLGKGVKEFRDASSEGPDSSVATTITTPAPPPVVTPPAVTTAPPSAMTPNGTIANAEQDLQNVGDTVVKS